MGQREVYPLQPLNTSASFVAPRHAGPWEQESMIRIIYWGLVALDILVLLMLFLHGLAAAGSADQPATYWLSIGVYSVLSLGTLGMAACCMRERRRLLAGRT